MTRCTAASGILAAALMWGAARAAVTVTEPSRGLKVIASRKFTVSWTGTKQDQVEIDLHYCGQDCDDPEWCGEWMTALCNNGKEGGCPHVDGEYDVAMPEPPHKLGKYKVRVRDMDDEWNSGCSGAFSLLASHETPAPDDPDGASLKVTSPVDGDGAVTGEDYTVEFEYNNGVGSSTDRFKIDLYRANSNDGDCGEWVTSVCDKPSIGCKDSTGDYDVRIPLGTIPGDYRLRVGRFEDDSLYDCSGTFSVVSHFPAAYYDSRDEGDFFRRGDGDDEETARQSFSYDFYDEIDDDDWRDVSDLEDGSVSAGEEDYDLDDDSVSAGDQVESPPSDTWDWMWSDDGMRGDDDYSQSFDIFAPIAAGWSP